MATAEEIDRFFDVAKGITLDAAKVIRSAFNRAKDVQTKKGHWDPVTEYDKKVEEILITRLGKEFPEHKFISEEMSAAEKLIPELTDAPTWIIDPIDGTVNFVHAFPQTCLSIALAVGKQLEIGIVYNPSNDEMYTAKKGQGAFLNGQPIRTSQVTELRDALITFEPGILRSTTNRDMAMGRLEALTLATHGARSLGSAALALAYVARGIIDLFHLDNLQPWDVAAGVLLVREAGGVVIDTQGGEYDIMAPRTIAAGNDSLAKGTSMLIIETDLKMKRKRLKKT